MSVLTTASVKNVLVAEGMEVYRIQGDTVEVAERVRLHLMDSGVRVVTGPRPEVRFTARTQRSENHLLSAEAQFDRVRKAVGVVAAAEGWHEVDTQSINVCDPVDRAKILDVFYEVTFARDVTGTDEVGTVVRWALGIEKYVSG